MGGDCSNASKVVYIQYRFSKKESARKFYSELGYTLRWLCRRIKSVINIT